MKWWCRGCQCSQYQPLTRNIHFKMVGNQLDGLNQTFTTKRWFFHQTSIKNWLFGVPAPPISLFLYHLTASEKKVLLYYPNNSCLIYLPTFTIKINQIKCRYTIHGMGYISQMGRCFKIMQKGLKIVFHHSEIKSQDLSLAFLIRRRFQTVLTPVSIQPFSFSAVFLWGLAGHSWQNKITISTEPASLSPIKIGKVGQPK